MDNVPVGLNPTGKADPFGLTNFPLRVEFRYLTEGIM
jgi:hypothetical protein